MANKSDKRYEIDVLLSMARITTNESKRTEYLNRVELLLDNPCEETELKPYEINSYGDERIRTVVQNFIETYGGASQFVGEKTEETFNMFNEYCLEEGGVLISKVQFGKYFCNITNLKSKVMKRKNEHYRVYTTNG